MQIFFQLMLKFHHLSPLNENSRIYHFLNTGVNLEFYFFILTFQVNHLDGFHHFMQYKFLKFLFYDNKLLFFKEELHLIG